jgi:hypothetical protein
LTKAWGDTVLKQLSGRARARFSAGRFTAVEDGKATFALPNDVHRGRCEEIRPEAEAALAAHFGAPVPLRLVVDAPLTAAPAAVPDDDVVDLDDLRAAPAEAASPVARVKEAFPGAEEITS